MDDGSCCHLIGLTSTLTATILSIVSMLIGGWSIQTDAKYILYYGLNGICSEDKDDDDNTLHCMSYAAFGHLSDPGSISHPITHTRIYNLVVYILFILKILAYIGTHFQCISTLFATVFVLSMYFPHPNRFTSEKLFKAALLSAGLGTFIGFTVCVIWVKGHAIMKNSFPDMVQGKNLGYPFFLHLGSAVLQFAGIMFISGCKSSSSEYVSQSTN